MSVDDEPLYSITELACGFILDEGMHVQKLDDGESSDGPDAHVGMMIRFLITFGECVVSTRTEARRPVEWGVFSQFFGSLHRSYLHLNHEHSKRLVSIVVCGAPVPNPQIITENVVHRTFLRIFFKVFPTRIRMSERERGRLHTSTVRPPSVRASEKMPEQERENLTALIDQARDGSTDARAKLLEAVYGEFHRIADGLMRSERRGHTLQPSALVNEAVIRLLDGEAIQKAPNRRYLLAAAAQAMRRVLIDHARRRKAREGRLERVPLDDVLAYFEQKHLDFIELNDALDRLACASRAPGDGCGLAVSSPGLTSAQVADVLDVGLATVEGDWRFARAWLRSQVGEVAR